MILVVVMVVAVGCGRDEACAGADGVQALYEQGLFYAESGDSPRALDCYGRALLEMTPECNPELQAEIHSRIMRLYENQSLYRQALNHGRAALALVSAAADTAAVIRMLTVVGTYYHRLEQQDSAETAFNRARSLSGIYGDSSLMDRADLELLKFEIAAKRYASADSLLSHNCRLASVTPENEDVREAVKACYFFSTEQWDSCIAYSERRIATGNAYGRMFGHNGLAESYMRLNQPQKAMLHMEEYHRLLDSMRLAENQAMMLNAEANYNYSLRERENQQLKLRAIERERIIVLLIGGVLVVVAVCVWLVSRQRTRILRLTLDRERIARLLNELQTREQRPADEKALRESDIVKKVMHLIDCPTGDSLTDAEWEALLRAVDSAYPDFTARLTALELTRKEMRVSALVKLGLGQKAIAVVTGSRENSVGMIRNRLSRRLNAEKPSAKLWDEFIHSL